MPSTMLAGSEQIPSYNKEALGGERRRQVALLIVGIVLVLSGLVNLGNVAAGSAEEYVGFLLAELLFFVIGGLMIAFGIRRMKKKNATLNLAFPMMREGNKINTAELAGQAGITEEEARKYIREAQRAGLIDAATQIE